MDKLLNKNYLVEKSKPLIWAKFSEYSLAEMRLVDTYLSKINARNAESSEVTFSADEYLSLLGYKEPEKVTSKRIEKTLKNFLSTQIKIDLNNQGDYRLVNLFSDAYVINSDPDFAKRTITIDCNPKLKEAFFNLAATGYVEYQLDYSLRLKSKYAIKLYTLLKDNLYKKIWRVELNELRELLGATNKNNEIFREFNKVLLNCQKNINSITDIEFEYTKITRGRLTRAIEFIIRKKQKNVDVIIDQQDFDVTEEPVVEEFDWTQYSGWKNQYFMVTMKEINMSWDMTEAQCNFIVDKIYEELVLNRPGIEEMRLSDVQLVKMEMINKVLKFAAAGNAKNLYKWLTTGSVWKSILKEFK